MLKGLSFKIEIELDKIEKGELDLNNQGKALSDLLSKDSTIKVPNQNQNSENQEDYYVADFEGKVSPLLFCLELGKICPSFNSTPNTWCKGQPKLFSFEEFPDFKEILISKLSVR